MNIKLELERVAHREPFLCAWALVFIVVELVVVIALQAWALFQ